MDLQTCHTVLSSLVADWQATAALVARGLGALELNPVIRALGPDVYFGAGAIAAAGTCGGWPPWAAAAYWILQTWAVNTHAATGTIVSWPLLVFGASW